MSGEHVEREASVREAAAESDESDSAESGDNDRAESYRGGNGNGDSDGGQQPLEVGAIF